VERLRKDIKTILFFLLPGLLVYTIMLVLPIIILVIMSLFEWNGIRSNPMIFIGIENFLRVLTDAHFWIAVKNIAWFMILTLLTQLPIGLFLAVLLNTHFPGYKLFKTIFFVPVVLSTTVVSLVWRFILQPAGVLNTILSIIGFESLTHFWLVEPATAMTSIILVNAWVGIGFHMTITYAAISGIPEEIMESALLEGCVGIKRTFLIIIPMIWETITSCIIIIVTAVLKTFDLVFVMTEGGPNGLTEVPSTLLYKEAFRYRNFGSAAAIGVFIFALSILLTIISLGITMREQLEY
jgi:raffinose/stachyose/melibiose transport system permease protein